MQRIIRVTIDNKTSSIAFRCPDNGCYTCWNIRIIIIKPNWIDRNDRWLSLRQNPIEPSFFFFPYVFLRCTLSVLIIILVTRFSNTVRTPIPTQDITSRRSGDQKKKKISVSNIYNVLIKYFAFRFMVLNVFR